MSAVQHIHRKTLTAITLPKKSPSGKMFLVTAHEKVLGGVHLSLHEEHPDLVGKVCEVSYLSTQEPELVYRLLLRAMSASVEEGATWLVVTCELGESLFRNMGFRLLQTNKTTSQVFYLRDFSESWLG